MFYLIYSSGIHSNGLSLARDILPKNMWLNLLTPTRIYVNPILDILSKYDVHGMAHITGGGFLNLNRLTDYGFTLDSLPEVSPIFKKIQELGSVSDDEMYRTFNMGVGLCLVVSKGDCESILSTYKDFGVYKIGYICDDSGVYIDRQGDCFKLTRVIY